jgi:hypothetical protein
MVSAPRGQMSGTRRVVWWTFVAVVTATGLLISAAEVGMAEWLDSRVGAVVVLVACALIFGALLWIASKLD